MRLLRFILLPFAGLFAGCSPSAESGLTKQEIQDITTFMAKRTSNHLVGMRREPSGDVTVWTAPLHESTNGMGRTFTVSRQQSGWVVISQKQERVNESQGSLAADE